MAGGYGAFGAHAAKRLARDPQLEIVIAGRSAEKAARCAAELRATAAARLEHAVIESDAAGYFITDKGSITGTYVNRKPVETARLSKGDVTFQIPPQRSGARLRTYS